jgi:hypothetical protein
MRWSYSASRTFRQCQRQWYFKSVVSNGKAKDPQRRRAYLLSKLDSVSAWRGKIVDEVISKTIVPALNRKMPIKLGEAKAKARELYNRRLAFALRHPIDDPDLKVSEEGEDFSLFYGLEYGTPPSQEELAQAWSDIDQALNTLYTTDAIKDPLKTSEYLVAQRPLQFDLMNGVTVISYPDVIAFRKAASPAIVDWKVHTFGENDAWLQLAIYAIAISRSKHSDFPAEFSCSPNDVQLLEAQLLTASIREHRLDADQFNDAEDYISSSAYEMACLLDGRKYKDVRASDFSPAADAESCQRCPFRGPCWENANVH